MKGFIGKVAYLLVCCVIGSVSVPVFEHFFFAPVEEQPVNDVLVGATLMADLDAAFAAAKKQ